MKPVVLRRYAPIYSRTVSAMVLCVLCLAPESYALGGPRQVKRQEGLTSQQKVQHVLSRFTFGARPGEEQAVLHEGMDRWFDQQLHPERIDDAALEERLGQYPAMKLSQSQLLEDFPVALRVRYLLTHNMNAPTTGDPVERAIYADYIERYKLGLRFEAQGGKRGELSLSQLVQAEKPTSSETATDADGVPAHGRHLPGLVQAASEILPPASLKPAQMNALLALPAEERFKRIVAMSPSDELHFVAVMRSRLPLVVVGFTPAQREAFAAMSNPARVVAAETLETRLLRDVYSQRQLQAVMTDFWLNHFSVYLRKNQYEPYLLNGYENQAILPNALGSFEQLLIATAESPAMLMYLDNWESIGPDSIFAQRAAHAQTPRTKRAMTGINENYARELMELHSVGVNGGYTQKDVIEVAKCFTGWTLTRPEVENGGGYTFRFDPTRHEGGAKVVMGVTIPEGGMQEGLTVLHLLATSPKTAHFIAHKLAVRFVSDAPPASLVDRMATSFLQSNGDIATVLETMYHSPEFWEPATYRAKVKTPIDFLVSSLRASGAEVKNAATLVQAADRLGMPLYGMQTPNGYSWESAAWISSGALVNRMNFALVLSGNHLRGTSIDWGQFVPANSSADGAERRLEVAILNGPATANTRTAVLEQVKNPAVPEQAEKSYLERVDIGSDFRRMGYEDMAEEETRSSPLLSSERHSENGQKDRPVSPVEVMAGLLLGSPDFQRR